MSLVRSAQSLRKAHLSPEFFLLPSAKAGSMIALGCGDSSGVVVDLCSREHFDAAFGTAFGEYALESLAWRLRKWGGVVAPLVGSKLLVSGLDPVVDEASRGSITALLESWQVELCDTVLRESGISALPVVSVDVARPRSRIANAGDRSSFAQWDCVNASRPWLRPPQASQEWRADYERYMHVATVVHEARQLGRITLKYQPILDCENPDVVLYEEALVRVDNGSKGFRNDRLFPALERIGLVRAIDRWVALQAVAVLEADPEARLGVNVSAQSMVFDPWWYSLVDRLASRPDVASRLTFELTETTPLHELDVVAGFAGLMRTLGCSIALDDFGAGYSNLALVRLLRPNYIKIDRALIVEARLSRAAGGGLRGLVTWCRSQGATVIAEGIEEVPEMQAAFGAGVNWMQGFWFREPQARLPATECCTNP